MSAAVNFNSPGVRIRELSSGVPQIQGVPTSVGGFVGRCARGPVALAIRITSFPSFTQIFGPQIPNSYLSESVRAFFDNGGSVCYIIRVLGSSAGTNVKATLTSGTAGGASSGSESSSASSFPADLVAGMTFIGEVDAGGPVTVTIDATPAHVTGTGATYAAVSAGHHLDVLVQGDINKQVIAFAGTENTQALFLAAINSQLRYATAINNGGQIEIVTSWEGSSASGSVLSTTSSDVLASLGLTATAFTNPGPNNVANVDAVADTEIATLFNSNFTGSSTTPNANGSVTWTSHTTGSSSSVQFTGGTGVASIAGFDNALHSGSTSATINAMTFTAVGEGFDSNNFSVAFANSNAQLGTGLSTMIPSGTTTTAVLASNIIYRLTVGDTISLYDSTTSVTVRGVISTIINNTVTFSTTLTVGSGGLTTANTVITLETFSVTIYYNGSGQGNATASTSHPVEGPITGLRLSPLSLQNYFVTVLGSVLANTLGANSITPEYVVTVTDLSATGSNIDLRPVNVNSSGTGDPLTGGSECTSFADADYIGQNATVPFTGIYATQNLRDLRMLAIPGISGTSFPGFVSKTLVQYAESRATFVGIIAPPDGYLPTQVVTYKQTNIGSTSYGGMYYPWVQIINPLYGVKMDSPPEGYVMGMFARTDANQGVQKAPAGDFTGRLVDTVDVAYQMSDAEYQTLYPLNVNGIFDVPNVGQCVEGSRTMDIPGGDFQQMSVRRTFIYLEQSLYIGTRFVIFEENIAATRAKVKRATDGFLTRQWKAGILTGDTRQDAYTTICDTTNNPQVVVDANLMVEDVYVNVPGVVENLLINIQQSQGSTALGGP